MQSFRRTVRTEKTVKRNAFGPAETEVDEVEVTIEGETAGDVCVILETYDKSDIDEETTS